MPDLGIVKHKKVGVYRTDPLSHNDCLVITGEGGGQSSKPPGSGLLKIPIGSRAARAVPTNEGTHCIFEGRVKAGQEPEVLEETQKCGA